MNKKITIFSAVIILTIILSCSSNGPFKDKWAQKTAPDIFKARFETTKGTFEIEAHRSWSPKGVDRLFQLIRSDFYTDIAVYRVVPNFVAQFGIHDNAELNNFWNKFKVADEPAIEKNIEGTISFARGGKQTRTTQLFINLKNNSPRLDTLFYSGVRGFPIVAKVTSGMDVVEQLYDGYAEAPGRKQGEISKKGNAYLKENFPELDYITKAYIIK